MKPKFCRPQAFDWFARHVAVLDMTDGLLQAAVAISLHALDNARPEAVAGRLSELAQRVRSRCRGHQPQAVLAHLHDVLFEEEAFQGNAEDYYSPLNSYLPAVLETRRGIPISLSLVYKVVAEGAGLRVDGINAPGHFLVRVAAGRERMLVDPFFGGQVLTVDEALARIAQVTGAEVEPDCLRVATHAQWLARVLANLQNIFRQTERLDDLAAMTELQSLLLNQFPPSGDVSQRAE